MERCGVGIGVSITRVRKKKVNGEWITGDIEWASTVTRSSVRSEFDYLPSVQRKKYRTMRCTRTNVGLGGREHLRRISITVISLAVSCLAITSLLTIAALLTISALAVALRRTICAVWLSALVRSHIVSSSPSSFTGAICTFPSSVNKAATSEGIVAESASKAVRRGAAASRRWSRDNVVCRVARTVIVANRRHGKHCLWLVHMRVVSGMMGRRSSANVRSGCC